MASDSHRIRVSLRCKKPSVRHRTDDAMAAWHSRTVPIGRFLWQRPPPRRIRAAPGRCLRHASWKGTDGAIVVSAVTGNAYEITVRFRDGSTTVFNEATPLAWRLGRQVIVGGVSNASSRVGNSEAVGVNNKRCKARVLAPSC